MPASCSLTELVSRLSAMLLFIVLFLRRYCRSFRRKSLQWVSPEKAPRLVGSPQSSAQRFCLVGGGGGILRAKVGRKRKWSVKVSDVSHGATGDHTGLPARSCVFSITSRQLTPSPTVLCEGQKIAFPHLETTCAHPQFRRCVFSRLHDFF